jgi:putative membrane protein
LNNRWFWWFAWWLKVREKGNVEVVDKLDLKCVDKYVYNNLLFISNFFVLKTLKDLILNILLHGLVLFLLNKYLPSWFWVESAQYSVAITFLILAVLFWIVNNVIKVILKVLTIPLKYMTFGLFSLVLNMFMIYLFEYFVNNSSLWITVHLGTFVQVFLLSLYVAVASFLIKKIV